MIRNKFQLGERVSQVLSISSLSCAVLHIFFIYDIFINPVDYLEVLKVIELIFGIIFSLSTLYLLWNLVVGMSKYYESSQLNLSKLAGSNIFLIFYIFTIFILMVWKGDFNLSGVLFIISLCMLIFINIFFILRRIENV